MNLVIDDKLRDFIDPLTPDEFAALERSLLAEGCRDALVVWGNLLVDGHNRYRICQQHGLPFKTVQAEHFRSIEDVYLWMIDQHLGRRSLSDFQRGVLALRKRDLLEAQLRARQATQAPAADSAGGQADTAAPDAPTSAPWDESVPAAVTPASEPAPASPPPVDTRLVTSRAALAKAARLRSQQVRLIETIQQQAAPEVVAAVKSGELSLSAAAAIATLPSQAQAEAAQAGVSGLKQAAKRVREARRKPRAEATPPAETAAAAADGSDLVATLQARIAALEAENAALRAELAQLRGQA